MPAIITRGAASAKGFGFAGKTSPAVYIEDVFSTYLYTGNGSTQTITNNIDLSTYGGLVWTKERTASFTDGNNLIDSTRGLNKILRTNTSGAQLTSSNWITSFNSNGFTKGTNDNFSGSTYASWTFRKQPKFFDIVTYTGDGIAGRTVAHNLGSVPGCVIVKSTSAAYNWMVLHRSMAASTYIRLNSTSGVATATDVWNSTTPTSTVFTVGTNINTNESGQTYVAYLFAHDAGGFGLTGTDNVISCGSFTTDGSGNCSVNLGWEPQWILTKRTNSTNNWQLFDNMRGMTADGGANPLTPNTSDAEANLSAYSVLMAINSTGF